MPRLAPLHPDLERRDDRALKDQGAKRIGWVEKRAVKPGAGPGPVKRGVGMGSATWFHTGGPRATVQVTVAPTLAADLADTLPYLVEYPHGCVEQTMSRFLPAVKVAHILERSGVELPELEAKLPKVVEAGVKRLLELQQPDGGGDQNDGNQQHETDTAPAPRPE